MIRSFVGPLLSVYASLFFFYAVAMLYFPMVFRCGFSFSEGVRLSMRLAGSNLLRILAVMLLTSLATALVAVAAVGMIMTEATALVVPGVLMYITVLLCSLPLMACMSQALFDQVVTGRHQQEEKQEVSLF